MNSGSIARPRPRTAASRMVWPLLVLKRPRGVIIRAGSPATRGSKLHSCDGVLWL
ncbi:hypothetical protein PAERUG_P5_London_26_VIM_2_01_09_05501 [Pseudomonas aeruginosa]|nr:hypothetical protein PAERUG_P5_London_26_VIM_2_01_09_05501 [Pseudomonas aeruginosa]